MTNLDRLRNMNVEELAHILGCEQCIYYHNRDCADHHAMDLCNEGIEHLGCEYCVYYKILNGEKTCSVFNDNSKTCFDGRIKWLESEVEE